MINHHRLKDVFLALVRSESPSKEEEKVASYIRFRLESLSIDTEIDDAGGKIGSGTGNLIGRLKSSSPEYLLLNAHMDTVIPGKGIRPVFQDGTFTSGGQTVLGADDKSGIAIILEALTVIQENNLPHPNLEIVFTVAEEVGLLGAKNLDYSRLKSQWGIVLDSSALDTISTRAPGANRLRYVIHGLASHAGIAPEEGINAVQIASSAISRMKLGRIDKETTANIGLIEGGRATNIVPNRCEFQGEVRSHSLLKLSRYTEAIKRSVRQAVKSVSSRDGFPRFEEEVFQEYPRMYIPASNPLVRRIRQVGKKQNIAMRIHAGGGGSDANIFNENGIECVILGTGMKNPHTLSESICLEDMVRVTKLLVEILAVFA
jgi:tripeptide aminopeptidase